VPKDDHSHRSDVYKLENNNLRQSAKLKSRVTAVKAILEDDFDVIQAKMTDSDVFSEDTIQHGYSEVTLRQIDY
jgi:hypothetical protein